METRLYFIETTTILFGFNSESRPEKLQNRVWKSLEFRSQVPNRDWFDWQSKYPSSCHGRGSRQHATVPGGTLVGRHSGCLEFTLSNQFGEHLLNLANSLSGFGSPRLGKHLLEMHLQSDWPNKWQATTSDFGIDQ